MKVTLPDFRQAGVLVVGDVMMSSSIVSLGRLWSDYKTSELGEYLALCLKKHRNLRQSVGKA